MAKKAGSGYLASIAKIRAHSRPGATSLAAIVLLTPLAQALAGDEVPNFSWRGFAHEL